MEMFLKACGAVLMTVILILVIGNQSKDLSAVLLMAACSMIILVALTYLEPVFSLIARLEQLGGLNGSMVRIVVKAAGVGMISEISGAICADAGNGSLGKAIQLLGSVVIMWLSIPLFTFLLDLLQKILGEL